MGKSVLTSPACKLWAMSIIYRVILSVVQLETMQIGALERGMQIGASMHIGALREASTGIKDRL